MSIMRRNVCARRSRPASARGFLAHDGLMEASAWDHWAHSRNRSEALPLQLLRSSMMLRTQVATGSGAGPVSLEGRIERGEV
jgi:hypothetical protein